MKQSFLVKAVKKRVSLICFSDEDADAALVLFHALLASNCIREEEGNAIYKDMFMIISHDLCAGKTYWGLPGEDKEAMLLKFEEEVDADLARSGIVEALERQGNFCDWDITGLFKLCAVNVYRSLWVDAEIRYTCSEPTGNMN